MLSLEAQLMMIFNQPRSALGLQGITRLCRHRKRGVSILMLDLQVVKVHDPEKRDTDKDVESSRETTERVQSVERAHEETENTSGQCNLEGCLDTNERKEGMDAEQVEYSEEENNVGVSCSSEECQDIGQKTMGMDAEQEEYSEEEKDVGVSCNSQECQDIGKKTMKMDAEQEEYSEEEKDVGVSCNSEECQDIEQKTTGMDAEQEEYSEEEKNVDISCNSEECQDIGQKIMEMDAEQEEYSEEEKDVGVSCNSEECQDIAQKTTGMDAEQEEYSEEEKNVGVSCNSEGCQDIGQKTMGMEAEQEEYSEEEKNVGVSCNSGECQDIGQKTMEMEAEQEEYSEQEKNVGVSSNSQECEDIGQSIQNCAVSQNASEPASHSECTTHTNGESGVNVSKLNPLAREFHPSSQTICPRKEVQPKRKSQMVKFDPPSQGRRRMRSCGPPQMLGVEAPPWSHPLPNHLPPRFPPIPPGRHCRLERPRVRFSASSNRPVPSPMNMMPSAWPNNDRYYTNQRNGAPTKHTPHPNDPVGLSPGVAPWLRPSVPNNWPTPSSMNIMPNAWPNAHMCYTDRANGVPAKLNPHAYNPVGPSRGVEPRPRPFFSNNRPTPPTEQKEYSEEEKNVGISCNSEECHHIGQKTMGMDAEQEEYSEEEKNIDVSCNSEECHDIGQKTMEMDAEQEEYFEEEKDVGVSCNSEECQDIAQKTMEMEAEQEEYSEEEINVGVSCNSEECQDIGQKTMGMDAEQEEYSEEEKDVGVSCNSQECEDISQSRQNCSVSQNASEPASHSECTTHTSGGSGVNVNKLNPLAREFRPSSQTICPRKEVQPKRKSQMVKFDPPSQGRRRMRSCGPPQMLGVEAPPWSHPLPNHLPPRFPPIPPGRHCRLKRPRVRFSASSNRPVPSPMNMIPSAWPNNDRYYTNQRNGAPTKHTPYPNYPVGLSPGVAPWMRPSVPNNGPIPSSMNIMPNAWPHASMCYTDRAKSVPAKLNPHAYNPAGPSRGVEPRPRPFFSNNRPTPSPMNIMPNAWPNANMCYMDQGNGVSAVQNPDAGNPIGPMPGVMPWPQPFISSNTWQTPSPLNVRPNTWTNNNVPDMDQGFQIPAEQNPFPYNNVGPGPIQVQQLSSYPTVPYAEQSPNVQSHTVNPPETVDP
ncbi:ataxin-2-like isoform X4 [Pocillopora verrucosa]|uniref:ataxin-2-like isoform X4 n=1 Tax=Pocillopora verrucosa TaxID=203993 RepID=UPI003341DAE7